MTVTPNRAGLRLTSNVDGTLCECRSTPGHGRTLSGSGSGSEGLADTRHFARRQVNRRIRVRGQTTSTPARDRLPRRSTNQRPWIRSARPDRVLGRDAHVVQVRATLSMARRAADLLATNSVAASKSTSDGSGPAGTCDMRCSRSAAPRVAAW